MKVLLRNPSREIEMEGPVQVSVLLARLDLNRESHLVIEDGELVPNDKLLAKEATIEVRPVISGGAS